MLTTDSLNVRLLDYGPRPSPDRVVSASGLLTVKSGDFFEILKGADEKFVKGFHREATRRGHASLLTTPYFWFWVRGSRLIDFYATSVPFGSFIIFSSRRIRISPEIAVMPSSFSGESVRVFERAVSEMMGAYDSLQKMGFTVDEARRVLPLGFFSQGLYSFSLQTIMGMYWERSNLPGELRAFVERLVDLAEQKAPLTVKNAREMKFATHYPQRHPFKPPVDMPSSGTEVLLNEIDLSGYSREMSWEKWKELSELAKTRVIVKIDTEFSLSAWNDIKRHRTALQEVEAIYSAAKRGEMYIPGRVAGKEAAREIYEDACSAGMESYELFREEQEEAVYVLPHALKVKTRLILNGYHLFDPFGLFGVRLCTTADFELRERLWEAVEKLGELGRLVGPKCKLGRCPERTFCAEVLKYNREYSRQAHESKR